MLKTSCAAVAASSLFVVFSMGCAHQQMVTLTSASTAAPPATPAPVAAAPAADVAAAPAEAATPEPSEAKPAKKPGEPMSFAELSSALGPDEKMGLEMDRTTRPPAGKGLSSDGYAAVGAAHQAVDTGSGARTAGDIKLSGGLTVGAVRAGVHEGAGRLRACYERGLAENPRLAGRVMVSFSVDEHGDVSAVDTESDVIPGDVTSCIKDAFSAMTFAAPKTAPAKIVYPIDFNKDS
jgi:hypothetical protein